MMKQCMNQFCAVIRDLSKPPAPSGKMQVEATRCISLRELVQQAVTMLKPTAEAKKIGLEIGLDQRLPLVHADPSRVLEVLINLVDNAIKFTPPEGSVVVKACLVEADPGSSTHLGLRYGPRHQSGSAGANLRSPVPGSGCHRQQPRRIRTGTVHLQGNRAAASGTHLGFERGRTGQHVHLLLPVCPWPSCLLPVDHGIAEIRLRPAFVLVQRRTPRPLQVFREDAGEDTWRQCLEILRHCVYLDKDLVLPPMGTSATTEILFVVASTDLERSGIMTMRIREQLERLGDLKAKCMLTVTAVPVELFPPSPGASLEQQVQNVADRVTQMIMTSMERKQPGARKCTQKSN